MTRKGDPLDQLRDDITKAMNRAPLQDVLTIIMEAQEKLSRIVAAKYGQEINERRH